MMVVPVVTPMSRTSCVIYNAWVTGLVPCTLQCIWRKYLEDLLGPGSVWYCTKFDTHLTRPDTVKIADP